MGVTRLTLSGSLLEEGRKGFRAPGERPVAMPDGPFPVSAGLGQDGLICIGRGPTCEGTVGGRENAFLPRRSISPMCLTS